MMANPTKSEVVLTGGFNQNGRVKDLGFKVTGIFLGLNMKQLEHENFDGVIANVEAKLADWKERKPSLLDKHLQ